MDKRRVVISGIGLVTPLGLGQSKNWNDLISGKSGINFLNSFDASDLSCRIGGEIPYGPSSEGKLDLDEWLNIKEQRKLDRFIMLGLVAAVEAIKDSDIDISNEEAVFLVVKSIPSEKPIKINYTESPAIAKSKAIKEGLLTSAKVIDALNEQISISLELVDGDEDRDVGSIMKDVTKLLQVSSEIPKAIDTINSLEEKVKKEQANEAQIRGGGTKGMFED